MDVKEKLRKIGQEQLLKYESELTEEQKKALYEQIESLDFSVVKNIEHLHKPEKRGKITPLKSLELPEIKAREAEYRKVGVDALKAGKVGAVLLAGGMGTRLGSNDPKGMYNVGLTRDLYIFECLINNMMDVVR